MALNDYPVPNAMYMEIGTQLGDGSKYLNLSGVHPSICATNVRFSPEMVTGEFPCSGDTGQKSVMTGESNALNLDMTWNAPDLRGPQALWTAVTTRQDGLARSVLLNPWANDGTPASDNPIYAVYANIPEVELGGEKNALFQPSLTCPGSGAMETFITPFPSSPSSSAGTPTSSSITISWTADVTQLEHIDSYRVRTYNIYQATATGGQDFTATPAGTWTNDGTASPSVVISGLTASTAYYFVLESVGYFDTEYHRDAEVTETTAA